jgi:hypothetical protein
MIVNNISEKYKNLFKLKNVLLIFIDYIANLMYKSFMDIHSPEYSIPSNPSNIELLPGHISNEGFLAENQTLDQVLKRDSEVILSLGYTFEEIANLIEPLNKRRNQPEEYIAQNGKKYTVRTILYRGWQECPWEEAPMPVHSGLDIFITGGGSEVRIAGLLPHLIRSHGFFEGGAYRVSPEDIIDMFGEERIPGSIQKAKENPL